jgi:hypothetical protein
MGFIFDDVGRVAELVHKHGMVKVERAVAAPEFLDVGNNLIVVSLGAARNVHTERLKLDS